MDERHRQYGDPSRSDPSGQQRRAQAGQGSRQEQQFHDESRQQGYDPSRIERDQFTRNRPSPRFSGGQTGYDDEGYSSSRQSEWSRAQNDWGAGQSGGGAPDYGGVNYGYAGSPGDDRGFLERAGEKIAGWFGDDDGRDHSREPRHHRGRGPADYTRSDDRIREDVCDRLTEDWAVDARNIRVQVASGEVTLDGTVDSRQAKRQAEDCVDHISGVRHVQNNLRVQERNRQSSSGAWDSSGSASSSAGPTASVGTNSSGGTQGGSTSGIGDSSASGTSGTDA